MPRSKSNPKNLVGATVLYMFMHEPHCGRRVFNPFPNSEILEETKLKAFADNKLSLYFTNTHFDTSTTDSF